MLFAPYFNVQGNTATSISITNTDEINGKAVKVRLRSAANSDDLLDFTVLLSPGDMWTVTMTQDAAGGARLTTDDKSCTLPGFGATGTTTKTERLPGYVDAEVLRRQMREGYIEVLNMADIPPVTTDKGTSLYESIKHANGVPSNCNAKAVTALFNTTKLADGAAAEAQGLSAPTGALVGSWLIMNQEQYASFSGAMTALRAVDDTGKNAYGNIIFAPQTDAGVTPGPDGWTAGTKIDELTSDPLLYNGKYIKPLWYDLPDMSTPLVPAFNKKPWEQVAAMGLTHKNIMNEYSADPNGAVPFNTDWVVSQPTRRYYGAMDYASSSSSAQVRLSPEAVSSAYSGLNKQIIDGMPFACLGGMTVRTNDREEGGITAGAAWSPGTSVVTCGEVFTLTFGGGTSPLNAMATNAPVNPVAGLNGWGLIETEGLPLVGFAATNAMNKDTNVHYGMTFPHRWND